MYIKSTSVLKLLEIPLKMFLSETARAAAYIYLCQK